MILWVDDNDELRRAVAEHLAAAGHRVVEAGSAEDALERLDDADDSLELLLTDLRLPGMNGLELARCLRARPEHAALPVLLVTSHAGPEELRPWQDDVFRLLEKPFDMERLQELVASLLAGEPAPSVGRTFAAPKEERVFAPPPHTSSMPQSQPQPNPWVRLALAAGLSIAVLVIALPWLGPAQDSVPELPDRPETPSVQRSGLVVAVEPFGPTADVPARFVWQPAIGAERYQLEVTGVDGRILWRGESELAQLLLPAELAQQLLPLVAYYWRVKALDEGGDLVATSESVRFRIIEQAQ